MDNHFLTQVEKLAAIGRAQDLQFDGVVARVTVDQFCALPRPTPAEIERFSAVMAETIPHTDPDSVARIADKLAQHPMTPEIVLTHLVARGPAAAAIVFQRAPRLSTALLLARAETGDCAEAAAIAGRCDLDPPVVAALARRTEPEALRALAANDTVRISEGALLALIQRGRFDALLARALISRGDLGLGALPLFLSADSDLRRQLMLEATRAQLASVVAAKSPLAAARQAALSAARAGNRNGFAAAVALCLRAGRSAVDRMIDDAGGEPLALIFSAAGIDAAVATDAMAMLRPGYPPSAMLNVQLALKTPALAAWRIISAVVGHSSAQRASEYGVAPRAGVAEAQKQAADRARRDILKFSRG